MMKAKDTNEVTSAEQARDIAIDWQHEFGNETMSWAEVAQWGEYFEALAEKFPELRDEFQENAII